MDITLMAAVPFSAYGKRAPTLAECEVGCSTSIVGRGKVFSCNCEGRTRWNLGDGSRRIRIVSGWSIHVGFWDCEARRRRRRDVHSVWEDYCGKDLSNSRICNFCCHGEEPGKGKLRAQHLGFERRDRALSSTIRGGSLKRNPLSVATREQVVELIVGRQAVEGRRRKGCRSFTLYASLDPYEILGVPTTATDKEIKQAYRKLALKLHPDVNKELDAQEQFLRVKNAYQALSDESSRAKYDASKRVSPSWDPFSWESERGSARKEEEEFYGFGSPSWDPLRWESESKSAQQFQEDKEIFNDIGEFFKDISVSIEDFFRDLQGDRRRQPSKPKSLWEELADIGEEFVEFLEKELNINETTAKEQKPSGDEARNDKKWSDATDAKNKSEGPTASRDRESDKAQVENEIAEIEDMLAQLKKELGI